MSDKSKLARWWCELNTYSVPEDMGREFKNATSKIDFIHGAFAVISGVAGKEGLALWQKNHKLTKRAKRTR